MKIIVGLGNPGSAYKNTRHNVGFLFLDFFTKNNIFNFDKKFNSEVFLQEINNEKYLFVKPQTFMNNSGESVKKILDYFKLKITDILVIHDDLDIRLGDFKIQNSIGPKLHGGINSIEKHIGNNNFMRLRIGVDNRDLDNKISGENYVLNNFSLEENKILDSEFIQIANQLKDFLK